MAALTFSYAKFDAIDTSSDEDECAPPRAPVPHVAGQTPHNAAWGGACASQAEAYGFLSDCFRLRMHATRRYGDAAAVLVPLVVCRELAIFCRLAVAHDCLPAPWRWPLFLAVAAKRVLTVLAPAAAAAQWPEANAFAALTGGRDLVATAANVCGGAAAAPPSDAEAATAEACSAAVVEAALVRGEDPGGQFRAVGGAGVWRAFYARLAGGASPAAPPARSPPGATTTPRTYS